jgi:hypothetical protein
MSPGLALVALSAVLVVLLVALGLRVLFPPAEPRRCPYCRERVKRAAVACRWCGRPIAAGWGD